MARLSAPPTIAPFPTTDTQTTTEYKGPFGSVFYDPDNPLNAYMLVNMQHAASIGECVIIDQDGLASRPASGSYGQVGFVAGTVSGSDTAAFVQIEGEISDALLTSGVTTAAFLIAPVTSDGGYLDVLTSTEANVVYGARCISAPSTATTPLSSDTGASALIGVGTVFIKRGGAFVYGINNNHGTVS